MPPFRRGGYHRKPSPVNFLGPVHGVGEMLGPRRPARKPTMEVIGESINPRRPARTGILAFLFGLFTGQPRKRRPPQQPPNPAQIAQMEQMQQMEMAEEHQ